MNFIFAFEGNYSSQLLKKTYDLDKTTAVLLFFGYNNRWKS